jgi:cysteine desulfuration protein SufE
MLAPHPFGHEITTQQLQEDFQPLQQWEARYRQLIQLSKLLPPLPEELKTAEIEIGGCQNRVWLGATRNAQGQLHFYGDSEGRIVKGLLAVLLTLIEGKTSAQVLEQDPLLIFQQLGLHQQLSASRASGLQALSQQIIQLAQQLS